MDESPRNSGVSFTPCALSHAVPNSRRSDRAHQSKKFRLMTTIREFFLREQYDIVITICMSQRHVALDAPGSSRRPVNMKIIAT